MLTTIDTHTSRGPSTLAWMHAGLFGAVALLCYVSPETVFGTSAWLQLPRVAAQLFGAALVACALVLAGCARSGSLPHVRLALLAAIVIDAQVPILSFSQPAMLEHFEHDLGIPWFTVPLFFVVMVGITLPLLVMRAADVRTR
jgi:hypothetical protein